MYPHESEVHIRNHYFQNINFLRFVAAFAIIIYHSTADYQIIAQDAIKMFLHNLVIGVDLFFIISGFLITYLLIIEKEKSGKISLPKFYIRRILRIFPLYYLVVIYAVFAFYYTNPETDFFSNFLFLGNFSMIEAGVWTIAPLTPLWSICIEEHFYLFIPLLALIVPSRRLNVLFLLIIVVSILFRAYATYTLQYNWLTIYVHTLSRCDVIALGGLLAYYYHYYSAYFKFSNSLLYFSFGLLVITMMTIDYSDYESIVNAVFKKYIFVFLLCVIFISSVFPKEENAFYRFIGYNSVINHLGKISYGLYMYHSIVLFYLLKYSVLQEHTSLMFLLVTVISIVISSLSYRYFEKPFLNLKRKFEV